MTEPIDQSDEGTTASDQPGSNGSGFDLEALVTRVAAAVEAQTEKRFQGFQSVIDKKLGKLSDQFKTAGLSPEQQAQLEDESENDDVEQMRRELELHRMRDKYPRGVERLLRLSSSESLEDQLAFAEALEDPKVAAQVEEAIAEAADGAETPVPEVDRNNPSRPVKAGAQSSITSGVVDNDETADAILAQYGG